MPTTTTPTPLRPFNRLSLEAAQPPGVEALASDTKGASMARSILPARAAALRAEGLDKAERAARKMVAQAWPHRHDSFRAQIQLNANLATVRDCRTLRREQ